MTQIPQLIWPDHLLAAGADEELPPLEAAGKLAATADVLRPVQLALAAVVDQPTASSPIGLDRARFRRCRLSESIALNPQIGGEMDRCGSSLRLKREKRTW